MDACEPRFKINNHKVLCMRIIIYISMLLLSCMLHAESDFYREQLRERIKPLGNVRIEGTHQENNIQSEKKPTQVAPMTAQTIYEKYCLVCHQAGLAGAPKFHEPSDWTPRINDKGLDGLTASAIKGLNAMPAKGTCAECTEQQIRETIEYMMGKS